MKTTPFLTLLYGLAILLSALLEFQEKFTGLHYVPESIAGMILLVSAIYMAFRPGPIPYLFSAFCSLGIFILYMIFSYQTLDLYHGLFVAVSGYIFVLHLIELWKFYGKPQK